MSVTENPLVGEAPADVALENPPLIRVIAQVRFPLLTELRSQAAIAPFQARLRARYPFLRPEESHSVMFGPSGPQEASTMTYWRFLDESSDWVVTLGSDFVGIETKRYRSRDDFFERFAEVLHACNESFQPPGVDRLGVRYINRVTGRNLKDLSELVRKEVLGIVGAPFISAAEHAISQNLFVLEAEEDSPSSRLGAKWGLIPANVSIDPAAIDPVAEPSWLLDLDAFSAAQQAFGVDDLTAMARGFAERIYSFFRWSVTPELLRRFGGEP